MLIDLIIIISIILETYIAPLQRTTHNMQLKAKTKSTESSCKQPHPGSQTRVGLLVPTHTIFCGTNIIVQDEYQFTIYT